MPDNMMDHPKRRDQAHDDDEGPTQSNSESPPPDDDANRSYYYDDSTGYEIYNDRDDEENGERSVSGDVDSA
jgi:hypothetical protein